MSISEITQIGKMKRLQKLILNEISSDNNNSKLFPFSLMIVGLVTTIAGTRLINIYKGNNNYLSNDNEFDNMLGI